MDLPSGGTYMGDLACNRAFTKMRSPAHKDPLKQWACTVRVPFLLVLSHQLGGFYTLYALDVQPRVFQVAPIGHDLPQPRTAGFERQQTYDTDRRPATHRQPLQQTPQRVRPRRNSHRHRLHFRRPLARAKRHDHHFRQLLVAMETRDGIQDSKGHAAVSGRRVYLQLELDASGGVEWRGRVSMGDCKSSSQGRDLRCRA